MSSPEFKTFSHEFTQNIINRLVYLFIIIMITQTQMSHEKSSSSSPNANKTSNKDTTHQQYQQHHEPFLGMNTNQNVIVETLDGPVRGRVLSFYGDKALYKVGAFLGIPYAEPPIRELRFRAPVPPKPWTTTLNTTDFSPICHQPGEQKIYDVISVRNRSSVRKRKLENYSMSEDCLTLNIYVPMNNEDNSKSHSNKDEFLHKQNQSVKLPVFFYIHGGSYYMGAGRLYPGQILAATQNMIVVTFNFRLGPLGFFSSGDEAAPGNYGLLDQAQALNWIHQNIHTFGGDKDRITIVGNSAGGASVMFHLVSPLSKGKFVGVTIQSGCAGAPWAIQLNPAKHAEDLATKLGCPTVPTTDMVDCIRTFSPKVIMKYANLEDGLSLAYAAVIDGMYGGKFLSTHPDILIKQNQFEHVPILGGFTKDEVTIWFTKLGPSSPTKHLSDFLQHDVTSLLRNLPGLTEANHAAAIHSVKVQYLYRYGISPNDTVGRTTAVSDFISDVGLKAPCIQEMNLLAKHNTKPVYLYEFHYYSIDDVKMNRQEWIGSYHESELQFIFGESYLNYSNHLRSFDDKKMSDIMMNIWANFVRYGNPTPSADTIKSSNDRSQLKFTWTNYTKLNQDFAVIGLKSRMEKYYYTERMLFWNFFFPIFSDYSFVFPTSSSKLCSDWEYIYQNWIFWLLISIISILTFIVFILLFCHVRYFSKNTEHRMSICSSNNNLNNLHRHHYPFNHHQHHHHTSHGHHHAHRTSRSSSCANPFISTNNNINTTSSTNNTPAGLISNNPRRYSHPHSKNSAASNLISSTSPTSSPNLTNKKQQYYQNQNRKVSSKIPSSCTVPLTNTTVEKEELDAEHQVIIEPRQGRLISISSTSSSQKKTPI